MKNARQENRENYLVFVQCGSDQMGCGDRVARHLHFPCGLRSNMGIGAVSSIITIPMMRGSTGKIRDAMKSSRNPGGNIKRLPDMECGLLCSSVQ